MWDADQYEKFRSERSRPFFDLLSRIPDASYKSIFDLGCGTGDLTAVLADHWPDARVIGIDNSDEMLAAASAHADPGRVDFVKDDIAAWRSAQPVELIVSNAAFHWVPDHETLIPRVAECLGKKGILAVQVPANFESPSHLLLRETIAAASWAGKLQGRLHHDIVLPPSRYVEIGWSCGLRVDAWETVYQHVLPGKDAVLEWVKGTALRPVLKALEDAERDEFLSVYAEKLRAAYPETPSGTIFPFRRVFFVARKS
jgi:trans-aconitate 2-methyltransferase